jgi:hypothetical protein
MITPDLAATLILIAAPIVSAVVGLVIGIRVRRSETEQWYNLWSDGVARECKMEWEIADLLHMNTNLMDRIARYAADEAKRLAPLKAANRKRHDEAQARKAK